MPQYRNLYENEIDRDLFKNLNDIKLSQNVGAKKIENGLLKMYRLSMTGQNRIMRN